MKDCLPFQVGSEMLPDEDGLGVSETHAVILVEFVFLDRVGHTPDVDFAREPNHTERFGTGGPE